MAGGGEGGGTGLPSRMTLSSSSGSAISGSGIGSSNSNLRLTAELITAHLLSEARRLGSREEGGSGAELGEAAATIARVYNLCGEELLRHNNAVSSADAAAAEEATAPVSPGKIALMRHPTSYLADACARAHDAAAAEELKAKANTLYAKQDYSGAVAGFGAAMLLAPWNATYACNRAAARTELGDYEGAEQDCRRAILLDDRYAKAWSRLGFVERARNNLQAAHAAFSRAATLEPTNSRHTEHLRQLDEASVTADAAAAAAAAAADTVSSPVASTNRTEP
eukprot:UC1_evm1s299